MGKGEGNRIARFKEGPSYVSSKGKMPNERRVGTEAGLKGEKGLSENRLQPKIRGV